jgi:hypothetical protein
MTMLLNRQPRGEQRKSRSAQDAGEQASGGDGLGHSEGTVRPCLTVSPPILTVQACHRNLALGSEIGDDRVEQKFPSSGKSHYARPRNCESDSIGQRRRLHMDTLKWQRYCQCQVC